ncbi:imm11 family protein [Colwellia psychrerythraea]|uniref:Immunity MXAN-0049 protein domain-containing protein n=1 Tax=Colwellia psychrerythraea TaxID=28229 RepID=A0A099KNL0_COLPS|nr:DUF1629 domain-containing protein [Colwellia psychrerythraea]KGJ92051.1 hypothetical protein GAB14E_2896 [Colwellia psychrerythraea]
MYYKIAGDSDEEGMRQSFAFDVRAIKKIKFGYGQRLYPATHPTAGPREKEPVEIIKLNLQRAKDKAPLPTFLPQPVPLMRKDLLDTMRAAGVSNLDAYPAALYYPDGSRAEGEYFIVNVIGLVAAADLANSEYDADQPENMISMGFDSLAIDNEKAKGFLMFRLAENIAAVIVHEQVVKAVQAAGIPLVEFYKTEDIAIL